MRAWVAWGLVFMSGCATTPVTEAKIDARAAELDFGDHSSNTLNTKAWKAREAGDHVAVLAYTRMCIRLYADEGKRMNSALTEFADASTAGDHWALNDVGTSLWIQGHTYADLEMYGEAAAAFDRLAAEFPFCQCWDPRGWFWRPADGAKRKAAEYRLRSGR